jgi:hypothetical protein
MSPEGHRRVPRFARRCELPSELAACSCSARPARARRLHRPIRRPRPQPLSRLPTPPRCRPSRRSALRLPAGCMSTPHNPRGPSARSSTGPMDPSLVPLQMQPSAQEAHLTVLPGRELSDNNIVVEPDSSSPSPGRSAPNRISAFASRAGPRRPPTWFVMPTWRRAIGFVSVHRQ